MARPSKYNWKDIRKEYETGHRTQAELCKAYGIPRGTISEKIKKEKWEISEQTNQAISNAVKVSEQLSNIPEHLSETATKIIDEKTKHLQFINNLTLKNLSSMGKKINEKTTHFEHKAIQATIDKGAISLGVAQRHANTQIGIQNNTSSDKPTKVQIVRRSHD